MSTDSGIVWTLEQTLTEPTNDIRPTDFSSTGDWFIIGSTDNNVYVYQYDPAGGWTYARTLTDPTATVWSAHFSNDGQYLAVGWTAGGLAVYDTTDWSITFRATDLTDNVGGLGIGLDWSRNDQYLAVPQRDGNVVVYETATWTRHTELRQSAAGNAVYGTDFSYDGQYFAHASFDDNVHIFAFDETTGTFTFERSLSAGATNHYACVWSPDNQYIGATTYSQNVAIWETDTWTQVARVAPEGTGSAGRSYDLRWSPDAQHLIHGTVTGSVYIHDTTDWSVETTFGANDTISVYGLAWKSTDDWLGFGKGQDASLVSIEEPTTTAGDIAGTVTHGGTPVEGATVYVVDSSTDTLVATLTTNATGEFSYTPTGSGPFHVATEYESGTQQYNAPSLHSVTPQTQ